MITKFCIICLSVVSCSMLGLLLNKNSQRRVKYFENFNALILTLISEIKFRQESLKNILSNFNQNNSSDLSVNISEYLDFLSGEKKELVLSKNKLTPKELEEVRNFFISLGTSDSDTQLFELDNFKQKFDLIYGEVSGKHKKNGGLYLKLSFLIGLSIGIIII